MKNGKSVLAVLALVALLVAACGGTPGTTTPSGTLGALSGDVRISGWSSTPTEDALLTESINAFKAASVQHVEEVIRKIRSIPDVYDVYRVSRDGTPLEH